MDVNLDLRLKFGEEFGVLFLFLLLFGNGNVMFIVFNFIYFYIVYFMIFGKSQSIFFYGLVIVYRV